MKEAPLRRIVVDLIEVANNNVASELLDHLKEWLDITKGIGEIKEFNMSLQFPDRKQKMRRK